MRITHVIGGLGMGGAEVVLHQLLKSQGGAADPPVVISMTDVGVVGRRIQSLGVTVTPLGMRRGRPSVLGLWRLVRALRNSSADVLQTWMYHADLMGGIAAWLAGQLPVVWGIHNSTLDAAQSKRVTIWTAKTCARLSTRLPRRIICCAEKSRDLHCQMGYDPSRMVVIPNGFDLEALRPDDHARRDLRGELNLDADALLIGLVARFDPQKDHANFVAAARVLIRREPRVHFVLCGSQVAENNSQLMGWIQAAGIQGHVHLMGLREDTPRITAALDIASSSSSFGEAFPLVLGEAMACGVPCVTTDVGDSALLVGDCGEVVPPRNPQRLAEGWHRLVDLGAEGRRRLGRRARQRIADQFDLRSMSDRYAAVYAELARN